jgi:hypothetical protein
VPAGWFRGVIVVLKFPLLSTVVVPMSLPAKESLTWPGANPVPSIPIE